jgi:outer membrane protein TolC
MKFKIIFLLFLFSLKGFSQDSLKTLNADQLMNIVRTYHPIVKQADIRIERSVAELLMARGAFEPVLSNNSGQKTFDNLNYYTYSATEIKIPTWFGIELSGGIEDLSGSKFDPTETLGKTNYLGVTVPLVKNLLMDKRRATLKQAKIYTTMAEIEKRAVVNDLLMQAIESYYAWVKSYQTLVVVQNNLLTSKKRADLMSRSFFNGEKSAIDTLEAYTQYQSFQLLQQNKELDFNNASLSLSSFLWKNENEPTVLPKDVVPQVNWENELKLDSFTVVLDDLLSFSSASNPNIQLYTYKLNGLEIDQKLKFQELLPKVDFKYNSLSKSYDFAKNIGGHSVFDNNFLYGVKVEMPLLLAKGRAEYKISKLKIADTRIDQTQKIVFNALKIKGYFNEYETLKSQIALQAQIYSNYRKLVEAEEKRFENGESSLFLINSRENKALESQEKLIELKTKYYKSIFALQWISGKLL